MKQPLYLDRDGLRDSVVEFYFDSYYNVKYIAKTILSSQGLNDFELVEDDESKSVFLINGVYRIQVRPDCISFNCIKQYQRWSNYEPFISTVVNIILSQEIVSIKKLLIRYISCFPNVSVFDNLNGTKMKLESFPSIDGTEVRFSMGITDEAHHYGVATIRLTDNLSSQKSRGKVSVVDLQIVSKADNKSVFTTLAFLHKEERNLFFSILSKQFIDSLGAHYS